MKQPSGYQNGLLWLLFAQGITFAQTGTAEIQKALIKSTGDGPYFQLTVPISVYPTAAHIDLSDLRIRNANGNLVPHAWLNESTRESEVRTDTVAIYPVGVSKNVDSTASSDLSIGFKQNRDGSLVSIRSAAAVPEKRSPDWIIDASQIKGHLLQARFQLATANEGFFPLALEISDDLRHWRPGVSDTQLVVLTRGGERIEKLTIDLNGARTRYLRVRWLDPAQAATISSVQIDSLLQEEIIPSLQWSESIAASACAENYCDYLLPAGTPADSLRISLQETNTLAAVTISVPRQPRNSPIRGHHRHHPLFTLRHLHHPEAISNQENAEFVLGQTVAYRLKQAAGEVRSDDIPLDGGVYSRLRIQTQGPVTQLGQNSPRIEIGTTPRTLVFLGQGAAPFSLQWGQDDTGPAILLATLIPGHKPNAPIHASAASVEPIIAPKNVPAPEAPTVDKSVPTKPVTPASQQNKPWLWGALAAGLLLLGGMAWSLFRSLGKREAPITQDQPN